MAAITALGTYFPRAYETAEEIAEAADIPKEVIEQKFGVRGKHRAAGDEHVSAMAINAARSLMNSVEPAEVGALIYFGSAHKDYYLWSVAPKIAHALGLSAAFTFELMNTSACGPIALKVAKDMLTADPALKAIVLVGASRESEIVNYRNHRARFAFNFADGAAAALVCPDGGHEILSSAAVTDGSFADDVMIPAGGSVYPPSPETLERQMHYLDVPDLERMRARLDESSFQRFVDVTHRAVEASGFSVNQIDFLAMLHTKRSLHEQLLTTLGLEPDQSLYLEEYGHMSAIDPFVALAEAEKRGLLDRGDLVVMLSAGTGYTWAATAIKW